MSESFSVTPLKDILPSYLYAQYSDDADLQAFVASFNSIAQGYLDWFNATPLSVYTSTAIAGDLLDWIGQGIYGITRPVYVESSLITYGQIGSFPNNSLEINGFVSIQGGTSYTLSDDYYKRLMTWILYRGDGFQASVPWLKRRVARFLNGENGVDVPVDDMQAVSVAASSGTITISTATTAVSQIFKNLIDSNSLPLPFQKTFQVTLT